jgi:hypothetical protein
MRINSRFGTIAIRAQLYVICHGIPFLPVFDGFEFQQTQVFAFLPNVDRIPSDIGRGPVHDNVGSP